MEQDYTSLEKKLGYKFKKKNILKNALTHSSFSNERTGAINYERLEFLGDSVLGFVVSDYIFKEKKDIAEGELTKIRANLVCESTLKLVADELDLGEYLRLGAGERKNGGEKKASILADCVEAIIAAIYLDSDIKTVRKFILTFFEEKIDSSLIAEDLTDHKSKLQELIQSKSKKNIHYKLADEEGPAHNKTFYIEVCQGEKILGKGTGKSKKRAEQAAAKDALERIRKNR